MTDELKRTVRILRHPKVSLDDRGRSVWIDPVESTELELVSTVMLERVLKSDDEGRKKKIRAIATGKDGVLAHDRENDSFKIVDDADLMAMLEMTPHGMDAIHAADVIYEPADETGEELSLVSTQALRRMLKIDEPASPADDDDSADRGFNPYDNS